MYNDNLNTTNNSNKIFSLYQIERLLIGIILMCFICTGLFLPKTAIQKNGALQAAPLRAAPPQNLLTVASTSVATMVPKETVIVEELEETPPEQPKESARPNTNTGNNTSSSSASVSNTSTPERVWVPPVYETIHHEAVYQTIQVVICNYCGATFGTTGEFQVHKDAHGG